MTASVANFSDLLQRPRETLASLRTGRQIRLKRRGDEDLVLTTASRHDQEHEVVRAAARVFRYLAIRDTDAAADLFLNVFPWVRFLPGDDLNQLIAEFVHVLEASEDVENFAAVWQLITEWKHTAEIHSDPELLAALMQEGDDFGPVPTPPVADR
jgi:hypothetical protein